MNIPSPQQLAAFARWPAARPVALFYQYSLPAGVTHREWLAGLATLASRHGGRLAWSGDPEQVVVGKLPDFEHNAQFEFHRREQALAFVQSPPHADAAGKATAFELAVISKQLAAVALLARALAVLAPRLPIDNTLEPGDEPGLGTSSVMPSVAAVAALKSHPQQDTPLVMVNWLKFRQKAAYYRYGKVALVTAHHLGARLLYAARYQQLLIGNGGDPAVDRWDEFALMQYPGRAAFVTMAAMRRYRRALPDREAGLAEHGQALTLTQPHPDFVRR